MSETDISICSRSLVLLGANPISSFLSTEGDNAVTCSNAYPGLKNGIMAKHGWRFLMKKANLTKDTASPVGEWNNSFIIPGEAISIPDAVFKSTEDVIGEHDYEIFQRRLYTDFDVVIMDYAVSVPEGNWPLFFVDLMVKALCAEIAFTVTDQQNVADAWQRKAYGTPSEFGLGGAMGDAMALDGQSGGNEGIMSTAFTDARFGGIY